MIHHQIITTCSYEPGTAMIITFRAKERLTPAEALVRVHAATSQWLATDGKDVWKTPKENFNVGELLAFQSDFWLDMALAGQGIHELKVRPLVGYDSGWSYDAPLNNDPQPSHESTGVNIKVMDIVRNRASGLLGRVDCLVGATFARVHYYDLVDSDRTEPLCDLIRIDIDRSSSR